MGNKKNKIKKEKQHQITTPEQRNFWIEDKIKIINFHEQVKHLIKRAALISK